MWDALSQKLETLPAFYASSASDSQGRKSHYSQGGVDDSAMAKFLVVTVGRLSTKASYAMAGRVYAIVVPIYALATRHTVLVTTSVCMVEVISVFRRP